MGVRDQDALRTWATRSEYRRDFEGKVKGLGFAVYNWLVMRQGVDTVKPDVHVRRFVEAAVGRAVGDKDVVALVEGAAKALGKRAYELDWAIWEAQRNAPIETKPRSAAQPMTAAHQPATSSSGDLKLFRDDDAGYLAWIARHPAGFVINTAAKPAQSYVVLHRASCRFISGSPTNGRRWTRDPIKVCAPSARQLDDWSLVTVGDHPTGCGMCSP